ncbi:proline racemase family protein [Microscilla marina]|nr:proline racemase family protein [Microscilla marina]
MKQFTPQTTWQPPSHWQQISTIDAHTGGEPLRIIVDGFPELPGNTILEKRRFARENLDHLRTALMFEPRGHADMYGCILTPPVSPEADFGVLFIHNEGYSTMCGHAIIALTKVALQTGMLPQQTPVTTIKIDTPAGLITAFATIENDEVTEVHFQNVPSFVLELDAEVEVPGLGTIAYDLAFGGAFYAYVQADQLGLNCTPDEYKELIDKGMEIKHAIMKSRKIEHPFEQDLGFLYGTIFIAPPLGDSADSRNVCIFANGEVDRSPTGTGVSGRAAIHHARQELAVGEKMYIESILDSQFSVKIAREITFGTYKAIIPEVSGTAYLTGSHQFWVDPEDAHKEGFIFN